MKRIAGAGLMLLMLAGCALFGGGERAGGAAAPVPWRAVVTPADRAQLRGWRTRWIAALAQARVRGHGGHIAAEGPLLDPDAGLLQLDLPAGRYRCRVLRIGARGTGPDFAASPPHDCTVDSRGGQPVFALGGGAQRPVGRLFADGGARAIFVGTMLLGDEARPFRYGQDPDRDVVGFVERIAPARWRLVLPSPRWEFALEVIELLPRR